MFDSCQKQRDSDNNNSGGIGPRCADVAEKLVQLFGWRQTYKVEKLQRSVPDRATTRISITRTYGLSRKYSLDSCAKSQHQQHGGVDSWVAVHNLQSQSGGGILDPDDRLSDVADDREQIIANFEDGDGVHHGGGDGASGSSVGTGSPDIFHDSEHKYGTSYPARTDIEVTGEQIASGLMSVPLQVRRGSEPALNQLPGGGPASAEPPGPRPPVLQDPTKRWSAAPIILGDLIDSPEKIPNGRIHHNGFLTPDWIREIEKDEEEEDDNTPFQRIARDGSNRLSMQFLGDGAGYRWADAAERTASSNKYRIHGSTSLPRDHRRKEPLGQANNSTSPSPSTTSSLNRLPSELETKDEHVELIVIRNEPGPLGIHVVPDYDCHGKDRGFVVQGIEPDGRIDRDGKLAINDRIIEINGQNLLNMSLQRVQELFKLSLIAMELRLKVIKQKSSGDQCRKPPAPVYPKTGQVGRFPEDKENVAMVEVEERLTNNTKVATVSPTKKIPAGTRNPKSLLTANTRKIGRKIELELMKGLHGLGFSITTRDNPAGGNCPIYIKNILPKGAAVEDGRLKPGDRLLEVNGVEMTGKTQAEAVSVLRNAPAGTKVKIVVSRQEDLVGIPLPREIGSDGGEIEKNPHPTPPAIPPLPAHHESSIRKTPERVGSVAKIISQFQEAAKTNPADDSAIFPWKHREILTFDIPVHDTEKAGLGVSVKGKTTGTSSSTNGTDLGIFVKSVLHGGAASRDKRLRTNDQLLNVNGVSLLQQSNAEAMETLRRAMLHTEGPVPGSITLTVARRASSPAPTTGSGGNLSGRNSSSSHLTSSTSSEPLNYSSSNNDTENSTTTENSGTSESSGNTVIFLPYKQTETGSGSSNLNNNKNLSPINSWNPVIDRITGQTHNHNQLRNESYYMATHHDTWSTSMLMNSASGKSTDKLTSPTVNLPSGETVIIEEEYPSGPPPPLPPQRNRSIDSMLENRNDTEPDGKASITSSTCDKSVDSSSPPTDVTYASQLSLENPAGFSRDAFGRQSMSEKRHATLDAKNTGTYKKNKKLREEREKGKGKETNTNLVRVGSVESVISLNRSPIHHPEYADKLGQLGPSLGMKKSSSLESLQTMVQEIQMQEEGDPAYTYRGGQGVLKVIRGRGCDESFRAAVDVDYNKGLVDRSETSAKKHWLLDPPEGHLSSTEPTNEREIDGFCNVRGGPRQSSLNAALDSKHKHGKKKPSILKGIGSMFRFGKHRKTDSSSSFEQQHEFEAPESIPEHQLLQPEVEDSCHRSRPLPPPEQIIHEGVPLVSSSSSGAKYYVRDHENNASNVTSRSERVHHLRSQHQQRHAERQGQYPNEEREEHYEEVIKHRLEQPANYDGYREMRPGSRSGITDPFRFNNHYVNYDELQHHISTRKEQVSENQIVQMRMQVQQQRLKVEEESRKQHQYHSQRQPRPDFQQRPVSNFYEYESVQSLIHGRGRQPMQLSPATSTSIQQHQNSNSDLNSNSTRHQQQSMSNSGSRHFYTQQQHRPFHQHLHQQQQQHSPHSGLPYPRYVTNQRNAAPAPSASSGHTVNGARVRGPFITHITIGNDQNKNLGSKV